jgi:hypothetical protein
MEAAARTAMHILRAKEVSISRFSHFFNFTSTINSLLLFAVLTHCCHYRDCAASVFDSQCMLF